MRKPEKPVKLHVKKGDTVIMLSGKDSGEVGTILAAFPAEGKVQVEGLNMVTRHQKARQGNPFGALQSGPVQKPAAVPASKVMLQCPHCHQGTRARRVLQPDGRRVRVCRKCTRPID